LFEARLRGLYAEVPELATEERISRARVAAELERIRPEERRRELAAQLREVIQRVRGEGPLARRFGAWRLGIQRTLGLSPEAMLASVAGYGPLLLELLEQGYSMQDVRNLIPVLEAARPEIYRQLGFAPPGGLMQGAVPAPEELERAWRARLGRILEQRGLRPEFAPASGAPVHININQPAVQYLQTPGELSAASMPRNAGSPE